MLLIFSRNVGLKTWDKVGNLSRELTLYNKLIEKNIQENFFLHMIDKDVNFSKELRIRMFFQRIFLFFSSNKYKI